MDYKKTLQYQPWLRFININQVSSRLLEASDRDIFIAYNALYDRYELHSVKSFKLDLDSCNAVIDQEFLNGFIVTDYKANNLTKFGQDVKDTRDYINHLYQKAEEKRQFNLTSDRLKIVERTLGRKI